MTTFKLLRVLVASLAGFGTLGALGAASTSPAAADDSAGQIVVTVSPDPSPYGQLPVVTALVLSSPESAGSVRFELNGFQYGPLVPIVDGRASSGPLITTWGDPLVAAKHRLTVSFLPDDPAAPAPDDVTRILSIPRAPTRVSLVVTPERVVVEVAPTLPMAPSSVTMHGSVRLLVDDLEVGRADVVGGSAVISYGSSTDVPQKFVVEYLRDDYYARSRAIYLRRPPTIAAAVATRAEPTRFGWYRGAVDVEFTCAERSAPIVGSCPDPVTVDTDGADQLVSGSIAAEDGGWAESEVLVSIDRVAPRLRVRGIRDGAVYVGRAPRATCVGQDALSGLASCRIARHRMGERVRYRAVARDKAGNTAVQRGRYTVRRLG